MKKFVIETELNNGEKKYEAYALDDKNNKHLVCATTEETKKWFSTKITTNYFLRDITWGRPSYQAIFSSVEEASKALDEAIEHAKKVTEEREAKEIKSITHKEIS